MMKCRRRHAMSSMQHGVAASMWHAQTHIYLCKYVCLDIVRRSSWHVKTNMRPKARFPSKRCGFCHSDACFCVLCGAWLSKKQRLSCLTSGFKVKKTKPERTLIQLQRWVWRTHQRVAVAFVSESFVILFITFIHLFICIFRFFDCGA